MLYKLDSRGFVVNQARISKIQAYYKPLLDEVKKVYTSKLGDNLHSFYIRGSVSVGRAKPLISDLDSVCVTNKLISKQDKEWFAKKAKILEKKYPLVSLVELAVVTKSELLNSKKYKNLRVYLKTQSICLKGDSLLPDIFEVRPGRELALYLYGNLKEEINTLSRIFSGEITNPEYLSQRRPVEFWCIWMTRVLLRAGLGIVMTKRPIYSQDLRTCYKVFTDEYPKFQKEMHQLLRWSLKPSNNSAELSIFLNNFAPRFMDLWEKSIYIK